MIAVDVKFDERTLKGIADLARIFPREVRRANGRAASIVKRKFRKVMRAGGGTDGVPTFAERAALTTMLHPGTRPGGALADPARIVSYKKNDTQFVGWVGTLEAWAASYQTSAYRKWGATERRYLYSALRKSGYSSDNVPAYYHRPDRPVVDPLAETVAREYPGWIASAAKKLIAAKLARAGI